MNRRRLGRTGIEISEIGFGCGITAGLMIHGSPDARRDAVAHALDCGINYFDTAPAYGATVSESNLGQALAELNASPIVATKIALDLDDLRDIAGAVIRSVEGSLKRLRLPHLALVQLHNRVGAQRAAKPDIGTGALMTVDDVLGPGGVVEGLNRLRDRGLVSFFGCCAFGGETDAVAQLVDSGAFDTVLVHYSALNQTAWVTPSEPGIRDYGRAGARASAAGMGTVALRVLEGGKLATSPPDAEKALRFALSNGELSTVLVGFSELGQIDQAAQATLRGGRHPA
jgi:aryl-alcohol dehydrogenase-like predicted oxidoreductase